MTATLSADASSVAEGGTVTYTVTLTGPQGADLTGHNGLEFRLADGSTVTIAAGQLSGSTTVTAADDAFVGGQDTLVNRIDAVLNNSDSEFENLVTAGNTSVTVTDEPGTPGNPGDPGTPNGGDGITVSIVADKAEFTEAEAQTFTVSLSDAVDRDVTVTLDGGNTVTIIAGETETTYTRPAQGDDVFNDGETVTVELESAAASDGTAFENVTLGDAAETQVVDTIDTVTIKLSAPDAVTEGEPITVSASVDHAPQDSPLVIRLSNGQQITIAVGETTGSVTFESRADDVYQQGSNTLNLSIESAEGGNYEALDSDATAAVTISDDADATTITLSAPSAVTEGEPITVSASVNNAPQGSPLVITLSNGQQITIAVGETTGSVTFESRADDVYQQGTDTLNLSIESAEGGNYEALDSDATAAVTISDDTDAATIALHDITVNEGSGTATISATLSHPAGKEFTVTLSNGATITFAPGATESTSTAFAIQGDDVYLDSESYEVSVSDSGDHNFESLDISDKATVTVNDTVDTTTVSISAIVTKTSEINVGNVDTTSSFTVTAYKGNGEVGQISKVTGTVHDGFGVVGSSSGGAASSELGYVGNGQSEKIAVEFNNQVKSFDVQFAWRNNAEKARVDFFDGEGNSVGWAVVSGGGSATDALVTYYDAQGNVTKTEHAPGGSDRVDNAYTFEPGSGLLFNRAEFTAVGHDDDYLIHAIKYKEVLSEDAATIDGPSDVVFDIQTSNPPDVSQYDFEYTFPTALVEVAGTQYLVNLDRNGKGTLSVSADGNSDLTATVLEVNGNFESVAVPESATLYKGLLVVGSNLDDDGSQAAPPAHNTPNPQEPNSGVIQGGSGNDVIIGDVGGAKVTVEPGGNYNIALIVDVSGSMGNASGTAGLTRMELAKQALSQLVTELAGHSGVINIALIPFAGSGQTSIKASVKDLQSGELLKNLTDAIDTLSANGGTNYSAAFNAAEQWFSGSDAKAGYENLTFFLTDGDPTFYGANDQGPGNSTNADVLRASIDAYGSLVQASSTKVYGVGIGNGVNQDYLNFFDNTNSLGQGTVSVIDTVTLADFSGSNDVLDRASNWAGAGSNGRFVIDQGYLQISDSRNQGAFSVTSDQFNVAADGSQLRFSYSTFSNSSDVFGYQLQKLVGGSWNSLINSGLSRTGGSTIVINDLAAGDYRLVYSVDDRSNNNSNATMSLNEIGLVSPVPVTAAIGQPQIVNTADELSVALNQGSTELELADVGDDILRGGEGDDIIFGDAIFTDNLTWEGRDSAELPDGSGLKALKAYLEDDLGRVPTTDDIYNYIKDNYESLVDPDPVKGGNDTLIGGQGDDILIGGLGADTFKWELNDQGTTDQPATDTVMDFNASEGDVLDISELLQNEENATDLSTYIVAEEEGTDTVLYISSDGNLAGNKENADQVVRLEGKSFSDFGGGSAQDVIQHMLNNDQLKIDQ
ncbi:immunoglobulin-like domain-containing protein [Halomonas sp. BL6]|uniref:immunoglobulin-like domain-containing protein n=1 Tax=Halomonas sp. BL6 TaxID=2585770 RepID=UPI0026B6FF00